MRFPSEKDMLGSVIDKRYLRLKKHVGKDVQFNGIVVDDPKDYRYSNIDRVLSLTYCGRLEKLPEIRTGYGGPPVYCVNNPLLISGDVPERQNNTTFIIDNVNFDSRNVKVVG